MVKKCPACNSTRFKEHPTERNISTCKRCGYTHKKKLNNGL